MNVASIQKAQQPVLDPKSPHGKLVRTTEKWVAQTFYGEMLKQMRESPFRSELFDGGRGGQAFAQMFDQKIAERISRGAGGKLVNSIVKKIERRGAEAQRIG